MKKIALNKSGEVPTLDTLCRCVFFSVGPHRLDLLRGHLLQFLDLLFSVDASIGPDSIALQTQAVKERSGENENCIDRPETIDALPYRVFCTICANHKAIA